MQNIKDKGIKEKTISGIVWSFVDNFSNLGVNFIIGIILARLLTPKEFGLIGMVTIFITISMTFVNSGFTNALIRKKDCTETDYSTVFYFNLVAGFLLYIILYIASPYISIFLNEPALVELIRVLSLGLIIGSLTIIQSTTLTKRIDFKLQTKVSLTSSVLSGIIGIYLAYSGYGVWSLVVKTLSQQAFNSFLLWIFNRWRPMFVFSKKSFVELFSFGSKLLLSSLIDTIYRNIYYLIIGKYFSAQELGYYTRANNFKELPSSNINSIISKVSYPVLSSLQNDKVKLKNGYKSIIRTTMFITFILMIGMAAIAEPMVITLIGEKWRPSIVYLQMLSFVGMLYPLHSLNLNMLNVQGRSDLFLKLEIIKKIIAVPVMIIGVFYGIKVMIVGMMVNSLFAYYLNSYWSGRFINYPMKEQIADILPSLLVVLVIGCIVFFVGYFVALPYLYILIIQIVIGSFLTLFLSELFQLKAYQEIKGVVMSKLKKQ